MTDLRAAMRSSGLLILLCLFLAGWASGDPPGSVPPDVLRGLIVKVAVANEYKLFTPLVGADDATSAAIAKLLQDPQLSPHERLVAAIALSYVRTAAARTALLAETSNSQVTVRQGVAYALGYFQDETGAVREALTRMAATDARSYTDPKTGTIPKVEPKSLGEAVSAYAQLVTLERKLRGDPDIRLDYYMHLIGFVVGEVGKAFCAKYNIPASALPDYVQMFEEKMALALREAPKGAPAPG